MSYTSLRTRFEDLGFTTATPFTDEGIDHAGLKTNLAAIVRAGGKLFIPCGNTGEYYSISPAEREAVVRTHAEALPETTTIAAGLGGSLPEVFELIDAYEDTGVDAVMVMGPDHTYLHENGLIEYYQDIAGATDMGVVLYKRGPELSKRVIAEVAEIENVVAVKFAFNDVAEFAQTVTETSGPVTWINGIAERFAVAFAAEGATGLTTGIGNFVPEASLALFDALSTDDWERAREICSLLRPYENLRQEPGESNTLDSANNVPAVKHGLELAGLVGGPVRPPLVDLAEPDRERANEYYRQINAADF